MSEHFDPLAAFDAITLNLHIVIDRWLGYQAENWRVTDFLEGNGFASKAFVEGVVIARQHEPAPQIPPLPPNSLKRCELALCYLAMIRKSNALTYLSMIPKREAVK